jgi:hypothetical protein
MFCSRLHEKRRPTSRNGQILLSCFQCSAQYEAPALRDPGIGRSVGDFQEGFEGVFAMAVRGRGSVDRRRQDYFNGIEQQFVGLTRRRHPDARPGLINRDLGNRVACSFVEAIDVLVDAEPARLRGVRRLPEKNVPDCAGFSFVFKKR